MASILVTFYSRSGNTKAMADFVSAGAREVSGAQVDVKPVGDITPDDLLQYDALILGSPVYYGSMAAEVKQLIDESVCHHGKLTGKVGGAFASSGGLAGGNETTCLDLVKALLIHGMIVQGDAGGDHYGAVAVGAPDERSQKECRKLGRRVAELAVKLFG